MQDAIDLFNEQLKELEDQLVSSDSPKDRLCCLLKLGNKLCQTYTERSKQLGYEALELANEINEPELACEARVILSFCYSAFSELEKAKTVLVENFAYYKQLEAAGKPVDKNLFWSYMQQAITFFYQSDFNTSKAIYLQAIDVALEIQSPLLYIRACNRVALTAFKLGDFAEANRYTQKALRQDDGSNQNEHAFLYNAMGILYANQGSPQKAFIYYEKATNIWKKHGYYFRCSGVFNNIGCLYIYTKEYDKALEYLDKALNLYTLMKFERNIALVYHNIGDAYLAKKDYETSFIYQEKARLLYEKTANNFGLIQVSISQAKASTELGKPAEEALGLLKKAEKIAFETESRYLLQKVYTLYVSIYEKSKNYLAAFNYQKKYIEIADKTNEATIQEIEQKYELVLKEKEVAQLNKQQILLEQHNQELQHFAAKAGHDLKAPIATIKMYAHLAKIEEDKSKTAEFLNIIRLSSDSMFQLITDLTKYTLAGVEQLDVSRVSLKEVIQLVIYNLQERIQETNTIINQPEQLPFIDSNFSALLQIFQNIISNAIKYQPIDNQPIINISYRENEAFHFIEIKDNGIGIKKENFRKVFTVFQRIPSEINYEGSGIGLATCQRIIKQLNGSIYVNSKIGKGSTFIIALPKEKVAEIKTEESL